LNKPITNHEKHFGFKISQLLKAYYMVQRYNIAASLSYDNITVYKISNQIETFFHYDCQIHYRFDLQFYRSIIKRFIFYNYDYYDVFLPDLGHIIQASPT
jgi:hypothetical protein